MSKLIINDNRNIHVKIASKFWARIYTFDSPFYSNLNWNLMQLKKKK